MENIKGIVFLEDKPNMMMLYGTNYFTIIDMKKPLKDQMKIDYLNQDLNKTKTKKSKKKPVANKNTEPEDELKRKKSMNAASSSSLRCCDNYQSIMYIDTDAKNNLVVVERPVLKMLDALPPSYFRKTFGS